MAEMLQYGFMRNAFYAGILASVIFGIIGTFVVTKRIVVISGGIAHASFGGVGLSLFLGWNPLIGAAIFAVASALGVGIIGKKTIQREDTGIGIVWALGMALGAFFYYLTPGYQTNPSSFLFGNILMISELDLYLLLALNAVLILVVTTMYHKLQAVCFDEDFSSVVGVHSLSIYFFLLILIALSIVLLIKFVGIILVIAMLAIPPSIAGEFTHDMRKIMIFSTLLSLIFVFSGLGISYYLDAQAGPTIIIISGAIFFLTTIVKGLVRKS